MKLQLLKNKTEATEIFKFLTGPNAYHFILTAKEKKEVKKSLKLSLAKSPNNRYWFYENEKKKIVGAGGIRELPDCDDGYYLEWIAIHKDYRLQGLGAKIVHEVERHARLLHARFLIIETGDDNPANGFYRKLGYEKVGYISSYYDVKTGKVIYWKKL